jgi:hypothetical protein
MRRRTIGKEFFWIAVPRGLEPLSPYSMTLGFRSAVEQRPHAYLVAVPDGLAEFLADQPNLFDGSRRFERELFRFEGDGRRFDAVFEHRQQELAEGQRVLHEFLARFVADDGPGVRFDLCLDEPEVGVAVGVAAPGEQTRLVGE